jgi:hypothetical protein
MTNRGMKGAVPVAPNRTLNQTLLGHINKEKGEKEEEQEGKLVPSTPLKGHP